MSLWSEMRVNIDPHNEVERTKSVRKLIDTFPALQGQDYNVSELDDVMYVVRLRIGGQRAYKVLYSLYETLNKEFSIKYLSINVRMV